MVDRSINILNSRSFLLFGARGVGKTSLLRKLFKDHEVLWINLLEAKAFDQYLIDPDSLSRQVQGLHGKIQWVVIDEIQKVPRLLDVVHHLIETTKVLFALSGSSAKKLRAGGANLLAGRAFVYNLFPLTSAEIGAHFQLDDALSWGTLPALLSLQSAVEKEMYLEAYALTYLQEEVWNEHLIRALEPFRRFLQIAAQTSGAVVNFSKISRDVGVDEKTVKSYFSILEGTLLGFFLEPYHRSVRKRQRTHPKFYLFDIGVIRAIEKTLAIPISARTYGYGRLFEHFMIQEIYRLNEYKRKNFSIFYLLSASGAEVDLIIERPGMPTVLVEIKSSTRVTPDDVRVLEGFLPDFPSAEAYCLSNDLNAQKIGSVHAVHWKQGLEEIGL